VVAGRRCRQPLSLRGSGLSRGLQRVDTLAKEGTGSEAIAAIDTVVRSPPMLPPADSVSATCLISVSSGPATLPRQLASADQSHNWLLDIGERTILARRRWTGPLVHVAKFERGEDHIVIRRLTSELQFVYGSVEYAVAKIEFLLKTYLEGRTFAFPIPPGLDRHDRAKIALSGWKTHGPIAQFARVL
jgi:hypothetical protein